jgi:hypothetical protein
MGVLFFVYCYIMTFLKNKKSQGNDKQGNIKENIEIDESVLVYKECSICMAEKLRT